MSDDGALDEAGTAELRERIRARRLADANGMDRAFEQREDLPVLLRWADTLALVRDGEQVLVQSVESGTILGPLGDNWRDVAPWRSVRPEELGPGIVLDDRLELLQYLDPTTGRSLWIDVHRKGDSLPVDFDDKIARLKLGFWPQPLS